MVGANVLDHLGIVRHSYFVVLTARTSTKGQLVLPRKLREKYAVREGDVFEFEEGDEPNVIIMRKVTRRPNAGLVDALLACPRGFDVPTRNRERPRRVKL